MKSLNQNTSKLLTQKKVTPSKIATVTVHGGGMSATSLTRGGAEAKLKFKLGPAAKKTIITRKF